MSAKKITPEQRERRKKIREMLKGTGIETIDDLQDFYKEPTSTCAGSHDAVGCFYYNIWVTIPRRETKRSGAQRSRFCFCIEL